jgi:hypothetical protein
MTNARKKGNGYELQIINELKELGYDAVSSRSESKRMDDKGVDIIDNTDFYFQCKANERLSMPVHEILRSMPREKIPVVLHKRNNKGTVAVIEWDLFKRLLLDK